jgi:hypothetical protein
VKAKNGTDWAEGLRALQAIVDRLVDEYGAEAVTGAVENAGWTTVSRKGGRPLTSDHQSLMECWLFVEAGTRRTGLRVNTFCARHSLTWLVPGGETEAAVATVAQGATLRRRYHEAKAFLAEQDPDTQRWWEDELAWRLAAG